MPEENNLLKSKWCWQRNLAELCLEVKVIFLKNDGLFHGLIKSKKEKEKPW